MKNYTSLIHGHNTLAINEAVARQLARGTVFGAPHESQFELGKLLCSRVPSIDKAKILPYSKGIPAGSFANVVVVPFNNIEATKAAIQANKREVAAIIIE